MNESAWHILGAGAMGCLWAYRLFESGCNVTLILRPEALTSFKNISIETFDGAKTFQPAVTTINDITIPVKQLLLATKAHQVHEALSDIKDKLAPDCTIISLQNGMGIYETIKQLMPKSNVFSAVVYDGVYSKKPFRLVQAGSGKNIIGSLEANPDRSIIDSFIKNIQTTGTPVKWDDNIAFSLWQKLAINCAINPLTLLNNCKNGELIKPPLKNTLAVMCEEIEQVLNAERITLSMPLELLVHQVATSTAKNYSSMLQDFKNRKKTEINFINGFLLQKAHGYKILLPENKKVYDQVIEHTMGY